MIFFNDNPLKLAVLLIFWFQQLQLPLCVLLGWIMGKPMDMNFELFEIAVLFITVVMGAFMMQVCYLKFSHQIYEHVLNYIRF